jgi:pimeloyl-ACP methyl ester carboxylesterase
VTEVLEPGDVLVGHSMGFWVATMAADAFPDIRHIVSVAGRLPVEGQPVIPAQRQQGSEAVGPMSRSSADTLMRISADGTTFSYDKEAASAVFFHDCDPEDIDWACKQLTPQRIDILLNEPVSIPTFWETQLPRSCIRCLDDRIMMQETYDATIRRLGVEGLNINASHSPFISRPGEFADLLVAAVQTTPIGPLLPY